MRYYMHTISGRPASYQSDGDEGWMYFADVRAAHETGRSSGVTLVRSLATIRRQQARAAETRATHRMGANDLGYCIVHLPEPRDAR